MTEYESTGDWVGFYSEIARLVYLITDFESYTAKSSPQHLKAEKPSAQLGRKLHKKVEKVKDKAFGKNRPEIKRATLDQSPTYRRRHGWR